MALEGVRVEVVVALGRAPLHEALDIEGRVRWGDREPEGPAHVTDGLPLGP